MKNRKGRSYLGAALICAMVLPGLSSATESPQSDGARLFLFHYETKIEAPAAGQTVDVYVPLAQTDTHQEILNKNIRASIPGKEESEPRFGNTFWHGHVDKSDGNPISVAVDYDVRRMVFEARHEGSTGEVGYASGEVEKFSMYLKPDRLVPTSGELVEKIRKDLPKHASDPKSTLRAIYDYVIDNMEYKKTGTGWGNGDTHWACAEKYGNCTDFHALFISLARAEGIPSRFEIGFPVSEEKPEGEVTGYHCWVESYLPKLGWFPIDASEAKKNPAKRDLFFGTHPADRIQFTIGRDLVLDAAQKSPPLNYFVYPLVEVGGVKYEKLKNTFSYSSPGKH